MKILLGVPEYPPHHVGGGGEVYKALADNYRKLGHEVVVIYGYYPTTSWNEEVEEYIDEQGIKFYQIPEIPYPKSKPFLRTVMPPNLKAWSKLNLIIKNEKPDVAHLHGYGFVLVYLFYKALCRQTIPYVFTIHGYPETQNNSGMLIRLVWNLFEKIMIQPVLRHAKKVTCISKFIQNDPRNITHDNSIVIYNGISIEDYKNVKHDIDVRTLHNIPLNALVIFSLGRIAEMKGFQDVIKLLPSYKETGKEIMYLIAGTDDGYKSSLEAIIKDLHLENNVQFVGFLDLETKKQYIDQCDIFAIPSLWEPFGLVALEGMVLGKRILTSGKGALGEVLEGYANIIQISNTLPDLTVNVDGNSSTELNLNHLFWPTVCDIYLTELNNELNNEYE